MLAKAIAGVAEFGTVPVSGDGRGAIGGFRPATGRLERLPLDILDVRQSSVRRRIPGGRGALGLLRRASGLLERLPLDSIDGG